jgi:hypothetical protein
MSTVSVTAGGRDWLQAGTDHASSTHTVIITTPHALDRVSLVMNSLRRAE